MTLNQSAHTSTNTPPPGMLANGDDLFRQLRYQTKNALQRILNLVADAPELRGTPARLELAEELQRRIMLSASLSDALFGLTHAPGTLAQRLTALCDGVLSLLGDPDAFVDIAAAVDGPCPPALDETVLRVVHELASNAVTHGMHARLVGHIRVTVRTAAGMTVVMVSDDGWGCPPDMQRGEGLALATLLTERHDGHLRVHRRADWTVATVEIPHASHKQPSALASG